MNCIASLNLRVVLLGALLAATSCGTQVADPQQASKPLAYRLEFAVAPDPATGSVEVTLDLQQPRSLLRQLRLRRDDRLSDIRGDGEIILTDDEVLWSPPAMGGSLHWHVAVSHRRNGDGYDAWLGPDFGLFRAEDVIPRAASRTLRGARSETWLSFRLPSAWTAVTQYRSARQIRIRNTARRLDLPSGWIVMGELGVRREKIAGVRVAIAGPIGQSIRRLDTLALLNWTLPELARILPNMPSRLTIVSAGEPMWRGGLSAPQSLFVHADRPLISENATSTLLHETVHLAFGISAIDGYDWIVEGLAEYYSLELLVRSGTISHDRFEQARADLDAWARRSRRLCATTSTGATTALAVGVLASLDREIRTASEGKASLDDLVQHLVARTRRVDLDALIEAGREILGHDPESLSPDRLPGCPAAAPGTTN